MPAPGGQRPRRKTTVSVRRRYGSTALGRAAFRWQPSGCHGDDEGISLETVGWTEPAGIAVAQSDNKLRVVGTKRGTDSALRKRRAASLPPSLAHRISVEDQQRGRDEQQDGLIERAGDRQETKGREPPKGLGDPIVTGEEPDRAECPCDEPAGAAHARSPARRPRYEPEQRASAAPSGFYAGEGFYRGSLVRRFLGYHPRRAMRLAP